MAAAAGGGGGGGGGGGSMHAAAAGRLITSLQTCRALTRIGRCPGSRPGEAMWTKRWPDAARQFVQHAAMPMH